jgi:hypothetical protein
LSSCFRSILVQLVYGDVQGRLGGGWTEIERESMLAIMMNSARDVFNGGERRTWWSHLQQYYYIGNT